ncbi:hypothetical protein V5799_020405 [Amblyomma americanum]|uniref:Peptidase S1 domain-containing protein n=1 Tax=Amblyomma americanum TaxID=6943 RepID=A0AAQ4ETX4_AMBAM
MKKKRLVRVAVRDLAKKTERGHVDRCVLPAPTAARRRFLGVKRSPPPAAPAPTTPAPVGWGLPHRALPGAQPVRLRGPRRRPLAALGGDGARGGAHRRAGARGPAALPQRVPARGRGPQWLGTPGRRRWPRGAGLLLRPRGARSRHAQAHLHVRRRRRHRPAPGQGAVCLPWPDVQAHGAVLWMARHEGRPKGGGGASRLPTTMTRESVQLVNCSLLPHTVHDHASGGEPSNELCTVSSGGLRDVADPGTALMVDTVHGWVLVGLLSWLDEARAASASVAVFTDVRALMPWLLETIFKTF